MELLWTATLQTARVDGSKGQEWIAEKGPGVDCRRRSHNHANRIQFVSSPFTSISTTGPL